MGLTIITFLAISLPNMQPMGHDLPTSLDLSVLRSIPLQHDGRWPPLDTVARDLVNSVTGTEFHNGVDPVLLVLAWTFDAPYWRDQPLIAIRNAELRRELALPSDQAVYSYNELTKHRRLHGLVDALSRIPKGTKPNPLESKVSAIHKKLRTLQRVFSGKALHFLPHPSEPLGQWRAIPASPVRAQQEQNTPEAAWSAIGEALQSNDAPAFEKSCNRFAAALTELPTAYKPNESLVRTELFYNRLNPFRLAWQMMVLGVIVSAVATWLRRRWTDILAATILIAGFAILTYGLSLRWQIAGCIPASNMYESLLFLGWGTGLFAIISMLVIRHRSVPLTASAMGAVALMLADLLPMNHFIRPIAPVLLDTAWMAIHVPTIMLSYAVLALGVLVAHVQILVMAITPARKQLANSLDAMHYWYIHVGSILLLAGVVTGSMWAASSWGRYWGWDPKEVWSLVALLGYLTILHVRIDTSRIPKWAYVATFTLVLMLLSLIAVRLTPLTPGKLGGLLGAGIATFVFVFIRGQFGTALKSVLAFWLIIMTYIGVNFILGTGLHSYGFGTGAVVRYMFRLGGLDLAIIALLGVCYLIRTSRRVRYSA